MIVFMGWLCYHDVRYDVMEHNRSHKKPAGDTIANQGHCVIPTRRALYGIGHHYNRIPLWSRKIHKQSGYIEVKTPDGWMREHRFVMEYFIGMKIKTDEVVHHIDGNVQNNNINNLQLMKRGQHIIHHHTGSKRTLETRKKISEAGMGTQNAYKNILPSDIIDAIREHRTQMKAARALNVSPATIYNKMKKYCLHKLQPF